MDRLRKPLFILAIVLILLVVLVELGSSLLSATTAVSEGQFATMADAQLRKDDRFKNDGAERLKVVNDMWADVQARKDSGRPPGYAISYMALLDFLVLYTALLMGASLLIPEGIQGRLQGCLSLILSLVIFLAALFMFFFAFGLLLLMVALFLAAPFGTIAYIAAWGFFDRSTANLVLSLLMMLKIGFALALLFAHQRFLQNKGLVLIVLTSLAANIIISFLHGFVPLLLVSITDVIAALIMVILAVIWAILLLVGSIFAVVKAIV